MGSIRPQPRPLPPTMRRFRLVRRLDLTGVSGEGLVAEGVQFRDGSCVMRWLTRIRTTTFYDSLADLEHIHGHEGATRVVFVDLEGE